MDNDNFTFSSKDEQACGSSCPLAQIPASVWLAILRPPFRRRHPIIFWGGFLITIAIIFACINKFMADDEELGSGSQRLALVSVQGAILDSGKTLAWLRKLENDPDIKGILLRVNSPGGGAAASQEIYSALARIGKTKPIVASMGATAASGGLMVSMAAEKIYANPSTITGSIGVRMDIPQLQGLMQKIGIGQETLVTAPYKDAASYTHPLTDADRKYLEGVLMDMHEQFVAIVAKGRHMPLEKARSLANGKIYTGSEALALGLVDEMGGQYEAHSWLSEKTGVPADKELVQQPKSKTRWLDTVMGMANALFGDSTDLVNSFQERLTQPAFLYQ